MTPKPQKIEGGKTSYIKQWKCVNCRFYNHSLDGCCTKCGYTFLSKQVEEINTPKIEIPKHIEIFSLNVKYNKKGNIVKIEPVLFNTQEDTKPEVDERIKGLRWDWDWKENFEPVVDKINELIDKVNNHIDCK
jgi:hypothetical protein